MAHRSLGEFVAFLRKAPIIPRPPNEAWAALIPRISQTGVVCEVAIDTYDYFLDVCKAGQSGLTADLTIAEKQPPGRPTPSAARGRASRIL